MPAGILALSLQLAAINAPRSDVLRGTVLDPAGASIPGASVAVRALEGGFRAEALTETDGSFALVGVPRVKLELEVRAPRFKTLLRSFEPDAWRGAALRLTLEIAAVDEEVTVSGESDRVALDPEANRDAVVLDRRLLDALPVLDQDFVAAASLWLDAGLTGSGGPTLVVDGMETSRVGVTASAIQEVRINANPFSAEFSRPGRGRIEITTRRDSPRRTGEINFLLRDHRLDARNAFSARRPQAARRQLEGSIVGPLGGSGRTFYLVSAEHDRDDRSSLVYARTPSGLVQQEIASPEHDTELSLGVTRTTRRGGSFTWRYELEHEASPTSGVGGFTLPEAASSESARQHGFTFAARWLPTSKLVHDLRVRGRSSRSETRSHMPGIPSLVVLDAFTAGGAQNDTRDDETEAEVGDVLSWSRGKHVLRAGAALRDVALHDFTDHRERDGVFEFSSLEDYEAGRPFAFTQQTGAGRVRFWEVSAGAFVQDDVRLTRSLSIAMGLRYDFSSTPSDWDNFGPRLGLAFAPRAGLVIRAGGGIFYDRLGGRARRDTLLHDGSALRRIVLSSPGYPDPYSAKTELQEIPPETVRFDAGLRTAYLVHYSLGIERQLAPRSALSATFSGAQGNRLYRSRDVNAPLEPEFMRPDPVLGTVRQIEASGRMAAESIELGWRGEIARVFNGTVRYELSRRYDDTDGIDRLPADSRDLSGEWSRAPGDRRHRLRFLGALSAGSWFRLGMIVSLESGAPYTMTTGRDSNRDGRATDRPAGGRRNTLEGSGGCVVDLRWSRDFPLGRDRRSGPRLTLALDAFNALNRVNYTSYVGNLSSPFFGLPVGAEPARRVQVALRLRF